MAPQTPPPSVPTYTESPPDVFNFKLNADHVMRFISSDDVTEANIRESDIRKTIPKGTPVRVHVVILPDATGVTETKNPELIRYRLEAKAVIPVSVPGPTNKVSKLPHAFLALDDRNYRVNPVEWEEGQMAYLMQQFAAGRTTLPRGTLVKICSTAGSPRGGSTTRGAGSRFYTWAKVEKVPTAVLFRTTRAEPVAWNFITPA